MRKTVKFAGQSHNPFKPDPELDRLWRLAYGNGRIEGPRTEHGNHPTYQPDPKDVILANARLRKLRKWSFKTAKFAKGMASTGPVTIRATGAAADLIEANGTAVDRNYTVCGPIHPPIVRMTAQHVAEQICARVLEVPKPKPSPVDRIRREMEAKLARNRDEIRRLEAARAALAAIEVALPA